MLDKIGGIGGYENKNGHYTNKENKENEGKEITVFQNVKRKLDDVSVLNESNKKQKRFHLDLTEIDISNVKQVFYKISGDSFFSSTISYRGGSKYDVDRRVPHGYGIIKYLDDGSYYIGSFDNGLRHGTGGLYLKADGSRYEGGYLDDQRNGSGKYFYCSVKEGHEHLKNTTYEGNFKDNHWHGSGTLHLPWDISIKAIFKKGGIVLIEALVFKKTMLGKILYEGDVNEAFDPDGEGILKAADGSWSYQAHFKKGVPNTDGDLNCFDKNKHMNILTYLVSHQFTTEGIIEVENSSVGLEELINN